MKHGYLVPHPPLLVSGIGKGNEIPDTRAAYAQIAAELEKLNPETLVVISPHSVMYADYFHIAPGKSASGNFGAFGQPGIEISVTYDVEFAKLIGKLAEKQGLSAGSLGEKRPALDHGVMVPLFLLRDSGFGVRDSGFEDNGLGLVDSGQASGCFSVVGKSKFSSAFFESRTPNPESRIKIIRVSLSGLSAIDHYRFGMCIAEAGARLSRDFVVLASGDMSHKLKASGPYGLAPEGAVFDRQMRDFIKSGDIRGIVATEPSLCEKAAECGYKSLVMMLGALDGQKVNSEVLCYEGPFGVGYLTASFTADTKEKSLLPDIKNDRLNKLNAIRHQESDYVRIARQAVEMHTQTGTLLTVPKGAAVEMPQNELFASRAGVFVSIKKDGELRGCIGTTAPTQSCIAEEIISNAISACSRDPRFFPVRKDELASLVYSVDVLSPPEYVGQITTHDMNSQPVGRGPGFTAVAAKLDVNRYGVIVRSGRRSGLLLPALDGVDTVEEQISIALKKAGIGADEPYALERFEVVRHK
ncbi:MAG: AmmeMemoRadiSam system protein A [Firmicutes bacterium]|nr:AmmeMemoRadiSam system protein A [Bacillota bacterium]